MPRASPTTCTSTRRRATFVEESGGANFLFVDKEGTLVVPKSHTDSILPSITRR